MNNDDTGRNGRIGLMTEEAVLITHKEIVGHMACWAVRQHPYGRPEGLYDVTDALCAAAQDWPVGPPSMKMRHMSGSQEIEVWLRSALHEHAVLKQWNTPRSGHTQPWVFSSRYGGPKPDDDFIDIDALLRNVALSVWREASAIASEDAGVASK
jgi:hypothetical protein